MHLYNIFDMVLILDIIDFFNLYRHGDVDMTIFAVPFEGDATVEGTVPVNYEDTLILEGLDKLVGVSLAGVFDAEIINN